jgi:hypothetical protein
VAACFARRKSWYLARILNLRMRNSKTTRDCRRHEQRNRVEPKHSLETVKSGARLKTGTAIKNSPSLWIVRKGENETSSLQWKSTAVG